jgi:CARDB protein
MLPLRSLRHLAVVVLGAGLWSACSDRASDITGPPSLAQVAARKNDILKAIAAQEKHTPRLMRIPGVMGTAVGLLPNGRAAVRVLLETPGARGIADSLDGVPVSFQLTGRFMALSDPTKRARPAPVGFSVGHPAITAGTIGARVVDASGNVYVLSNNHVLANSNDAQIGDAALQPGPFDGGTAADQIGTLFAFKTIDFTGGNNTFDAAIALSNAANLGNATPTDDGYGTPNSAIWGDANQDGTFDDKTALLGLAVEKYGRTTKLTHGSITGINGTVDVCYEVFIFICVKSAHYVDQLIISPGTFSGGGDSGSLIVSDDGTNSPVGLLFAGSSTQTIANRIDLVLNHFGVSVDGGAPPPPPPPPDPVTDIALGSVNAPATVTQGATVNVGVVVRNAGNQNVTGPFDVTLQDETDNVTIGTQSVAGLAAGASVTLTFPWSTGGSSLGSHTLAASHAFADDNAANDRASAATTVGSPSVIVHIGDLDGIAQRNGGTWSVTVEITVHDADHNPLNGATVVGHWSQLGLNSDTCTTGELGGNGTCIMLFPSLKKSVTFVNLTVVSVTIAGRTYDRTFNHDVDGGSNGTTIRVNRP